MTNGQLKEFCLFLEKMFINICYGIFSLSLFLSLSVLFLFIYFLLFYVCFLFLFACFALYDTTVFQAKPPTPPSAAQKVAGPGSEEAENQITFMQSLKNLITNVNYILLLISYGMNVGVFYAISTLLNPVITV